MTFLLLVIFIGARAIVMGMVEMGAAISWKRLDERWLLGMTGALSIVLGILLFVNPLRGAVALLWTIGVYAIVLGVMMVVLGVRLAAGHRRITGGAAAAA